MTTLDLKEVWRNKGWMIHRHIAGDLSYSYEARPLSAREGNSLVGLGLMARSLSDAKKAVKVGEKYGYDKAYDIWSKRIRKPDYHFGYIKGKEAKKYARMEGAYGEYAEKLKKVV